MRLIDADALLDYGLHFQYGYNNDGILLVPLRDVCDSIRNAHTVDEVEVVRCKNCENYIPWLDGMICSRLGSYYGDTKPDDFCSKGVRNNAAD